MILCFQSGIIHTMLYAVIVAGGQGTRLWPVSRRDNPKQIRPFIGGRTMLQKTYDRVGRIVPTENIWVATNVAYREEFCQQLTGLTSDKMILEPTKRNTAAAVGLAAVVLAKYDLEATMINVWSDHFIRHEDVYKEKILQKDFRATSRVFDRYSSASRISSDGIWLFGSGRRIGQSR